MELHPPMEPEQATPGAGELHPIRMVVTDDLERSRLTVFFRLLLAIPLFIWFALWSIAAFFIAILNWFATLIQGHAPQSLHDFFSSYVRFATHLHAYMLLAANPYPGFTGQPGYPVDVEIDPPAPQTRWKTLFRGFLAIPALILSGTLVGIGTGGPSWGGSDNDQSGGSGWGYVAGSVSAFATVSFLAWFVCLVRARMPNGIRDLFAYGLRYSAQAWGYLFLLTDRYPNADPELPPADLPAVPGAVTLRLEDDLRRSRLTVFFRFLLFLPHLVWLLFWSVAAWLVAIASWFATLATGRPPAPLHRFLSAYVRYVTQVYAYLFLVANPFPGFVGATHTYPLDIEIEGPERQARWKTALRLLLAIPAFVISSTLNAALFLVGLFGWFVGLALGRMPLGLRNLGAWALRYEAETYAYLFLLTETYPYSGPWEFAPPRPAPPPEEPGPEPEAAFA